MNFFLRSLLALLLLPLCQNFGAQAQVTITTPPARIYTLPAYVSKAACPVSFDSTVTVSAMTVICFVGTVSGTIDSVVYLTNGTSSPSFTVALKKNGVDVPGCTAIVVSSSAVNATLCSVSTNTFTVDDIITLVISAIVGSPTQAIVQLSMTITGS